MSAAKRRKGKTGKSTTSGHERGAQSPEPWLPDSRSVVSTKTFVSRKGREYRILRTDETDETNGPKKSTR